MPKRRICLNMIVKNEMANLDRCLRAVAPHIDCWVIGDTGSADGTQDFIRAFFAERDLPGELHEFPFQNFSQARNEALRLARASTLAFDYLLFCDADMEFKVDNPNFANDLDAEVFQLIQRSGVTYWNSRLLRRDADCDYRGVTHEYLDLRDGRTDQLHGAWYIDHATGANRVGKFERDANLLRDALLHERDPGLIARYHFYLANSLRDANKPGDALPEYLKRAEYGGWVEEVYVSLLNAANMLDRIGCPAEEVLAMFERADAAQPARAEAMHDAARYCRHHGRYTEGYAYANRALGRVQPDGLFIVNWIYDYGLLDELAVNAYWCGRYADCLDACDRLLAEGKLPADSRPRIESNRAFALAKLRETGSTLGDGAELLRRAQALAAEDAEAAAVLAAYRAAIAAAPNRPEPLYHVAHYCREKGDHTAAANYAERGLALGRPVDVRVEDDWIYDYGLLEEFSIAANYSTDPSRKAAGFRACDVLSLAADIPERPRAVAFNNLRFYVQPLAQLAPSYRGRKIDFTPPEGWIALNPSIVVEGRRLLVLQRTVNYQILEGAIDFVLPAGQPFDTRNFLLECDQAGAVRVLGEVYPPADLPPRVFNKVLGLEDMRIFHWQGALWGLCGTREFNSSGVCEQLLSRLDIIGNGRVELRDWRFVSLRGQPRFEKNWMPMVMGEHLRFMQWCAPTRIVDADGGVMVQDEPAIDARVLRGGGPLLAFAGGWLAVTHFVAVLPENHWRYYFHRFVWFDHAGGLRGISLPFYFEQHGVEFAAGLTWHPDRNQILVSFGKGDVEGWFATVDADDVKGLLRPVGAPLSWPGGGVTGYRPWDAAGEGLASFLAAAASPTARRAASRSFDAKLGPLLGDGTLLPRIDTFYEVLDSASPPAGLLSAVRSMRAVGHQVRVWTYTAERLAFLVAEGVEIAPASQIVPEELFQRVLHRSEVRYFSDLFRYALLYEQGGLWMDADVVLVRPFPYLGRYFFNLQWNDGGQGHLLCGNVLVAPARSQHFRLLYEKALDRLEAPGGQSFGEIGPKLLSDYVLSDAGAELRYFVFSPMLFNSIDWTETDRFDRQLPALSPYLNDERVFGLHLWNAKTQSHPRNEDQSLVATLSNTPKRLPRLSAIAEGFHTDKNSAVGNRHYYSRVYEALLAPRRFAVRRVLEIGLSQGVVAGENLSVALWRSLFPFCHVIGIDIVDFSHFDSGFFTPHLCDQSDPTQLDRIAEAHLPGSLDIAVDDGSHASRDQQMTFRAFFSLVAPGGWYFIENLDWQPPGEDPSQVMLTKNLFAALRDGDSEGLVDPEGLAALRGEMAEILFFDSHYELCRAGLRGGMLAIRRRGGSGIV